MNRKTRLRILLAFLVAAVLLLAGAACKKKEAPEEVLPMDRVAPSPVGESQPILHKTFTVSASVNFPFEVPAHAAMPRLHGNYKSFVKQLGVQSNDDTANVDFLILNEDQYADFVQGHTGEALFSADASHDQDVNVSLPTSQNLPQKYYLVFRNPPGGESKKVVQADFTLDF
jgi:hypothetical protein